MRCAWIFSALIAACSGPPPPAQVSEALDDGVTLIVRTNPLVLQLSREGQVVLEQPAFVEVGVADELLVTRYYDPAAPKGVHFRAATRATAWDDKTHTLTLALDG